MTKVFIGGSRRLARLHAEVRLRLDRFIEAQVTILIGDANGADKAVQRYLKSRGYDKVEVFCMQGHCRNNVGGWRLREIPGSGNKKDFLYHAIKDELMAREATFGFMVWNSKSKGTFANVKRLIQQQKPVQLYNIYTRQFLELRTEADWDDFVAQCPVEVQELAASLTVPAKGKNCTQIQLKLLYEARHPSANKT